jgi:acetoin utilization deacetylase AcuC-like enzyme
MPEPSSKPRLFSTDQLLITLPAAHKFPIGKYGLVRALLQTEDRFHIAPAPSVDRETLELVHDREYVGAFLEGALPSAAMRRIGLPWSQALAARAVASVGGTIQAALDGLSLGWGGTLGGGTHHAFRAQGAGFCVFNDIAVAIHYLRRQGKIRRASVVDLDVHQGDGTAEIFANVPDVFTLSLHCASNFPFRKQRSSLDLALPDATEDDEYLRLLEQALPHAFAFSPDIVFYQSGVDGLAADSLGHLALTAQGLIRRDELVMREARARRVPLVITSGGGYSRPIEYSAQAHANTYRTALSVFS